MKNNKFEKGNIVKVNLRNFIGIGRIYQMIADSDVDYVDDDIYKVNILDTKLFVEEQLVNGKYIDMIVAREYLHFIEEKNDFLLHDELKSWLFDMKINLLGVQFWSYYVIYITNNRNQRIGRVEYFPSIEEGDEDLITFDPMPGWSGSFKKYHKVMGNRWVEVKSED